MTTYITFVLDETGSMIDRIDETITGFNQYIKDLKTELDGEDIKFSMMKFNSLGKNWLALDVNMSDISELSHLNYKPAMYTPLWDAFGLALQQMETKDLTDEDKVLITVLTDGFENASTEFTPEQVKSMVKEHPEWGITFLGADIDAWDTAEAIGLSRGNTFTYDSIDTIGTYSALSGATIDFIHENVNSDNILGDLNES